MLLHRLVQDFLAFDAAHDGQSVRWVNLLDMCYPCLANLSLTDKLMAIINRTLYNRDSGQCHLSWVEYCAGAGHLSRALLKRHLKGACFDILYESDHNMLLASGVWLFVDALSATHSGALVWLGTPRSSFVSLCVSVSQRRAENLYYGDTSRSFVAAGNAFMEITRLLYF